MLWTSNRVSNVHAFAWVTRVKVKEKKDTFFVAVFPRFSLYENKQQLVNVKSGRADRIKWTIYIEYCKEYNQAWTSQIVSPIVAEAKEIKNIEKRQA